MSLYIYSYNPGSEGAKLLKEALQISKIKNEKSKFIGNPKKTVINWGSTELPLEVRKCRVINQPSIVQLASNKLSFFRHVGRVNNNIIPPWTIDPKQAIEWVTAGYEVCARTVLNGHSAKGLVVMEKNNPKSFGTAPLYTQYIPKKEEYRVHIVRGDVVDLQRKVLRKEKAESGEPINWKIRNLDNGFIYQKNDIHPSDSVFNVALEVMKILGLDFGAVDVVCHSKNQTAYVLEINTAPGITGTTVDNYANAFRRLK